MIKISELGLVKPILFRNTIIYITTIYYGYGNKPTEIQYLTQKEFYRWNKWDEIPEVSIKDGSYRTTAERRGMRRPILRYTTLPYKTRKKMKYVDTE